MRIQRIGQRLRGAIGNAVVWGAAWFAAGLAVFTVMYVTGVLDEGVILADGLLVAARLAVVGVLAGAAFSTVIGLLYRGRRLTDISWVRFGIGGAVVGGVFVPMFMQAMNLLSGGGLAPWSLILDDVVWTAAFGGLAAGGSLRLAQRAEGVPGDGSRSGLGSSDAAGRLTSPGGTGAPRWSEPAAPVAANRRPAG